MLSSAFLSLFLGATVALGAPLASEPINDGARSDPDLNTTRCPDFCAGTNQTGDASVYVCGDSRLGPVTLPSKLPLSGIVGPDSTYRRFGGKCPGEFLAEYVNPTKPEWWVYPPFDGYSIDTAGQPAIFNLTLEPGVLLDRFGQETGKYVAPAGAPYSQRSLPPSNLDAEPGAKYPFNYHVYTVLHTFVVEAGPVAPWFGQPGLGLQFLMDQSVADLVDQGYLERIDLEADPNW